MKTRIALFRGINVGGKNVLPMKDLKSLLEDLGATDIKTYIQSGNAVFRYDGDSSQLADEIRAEAGKRFGFAPHILILEREELEAAMDSNPFSGAEPKSVHLFFLDSTPENPDIEGIEAVKVASERFALEGKVFYLHAPDGVGRSKLAAKAERLLGVPATARNWRTVCKVVEMAEE